MTSLYHAITVSFIATICSSSALSAHRSLSQKEAKKQEVRHSMLGFRDTLIFYTFKEQRAILELSIGNKDQTFPLTGKIHLFDDASTEKDLANWINNQHSDGLIAGIQKPVLTAGLPKGICEVTSHKKTGSSKNPGMRKDMYHEFEIALSVKAYGIDKKFKLAAFTDTSKVHVKTP